MGLWRIAITRDEAGDGRLSTALRDVGLVPGSCATAREMPPADPRPLQDAAKRLDRFDWVVFASVRAVKALMAARGSGWPRGLNSAAVGLTTAAALIAAGADPAPVVADEAGADPLWEALRNKDTWAGKRVLCPAVSSGRRTLIDGLRQAGADVTLVEAYRMQPRSADDIAADWHALQPDAAVVTSPSAARLLVAAIGNDALASLGALVAIGATTASELQSLGLRPLTSPAPDPRAVAEFVLLSLSTPEPRNPGTPEPNA